jgi:hypothetical protein
MSATAAGGTAREQRDCARRTSETVEEEAADEVKRHCELLVENEGGLARTAAEDVILMQAGLGPRGGGGADMARRAGGNTAKRRRRSERIWTSTSADASESVLPVADSARFCRHVHMQSSRPHASKLEADGVEAERERRPYEWLRKYAGSARTGAVRSRRVSSCASRGVRSAMLWHCMCVVRGSSTRELENPRVRGEVGIANPFGSIISSHDPRHPTVLTLVDRSTAITTIHHEDYSFGHLPPTATLPGKLLCHPLNLDTVEHFSSPILFATGSHFPFVLLHNQATPRFALIH